MNLQSREQRPCLFCILIQARRSQEPNPGNCCLDYTEKAAVVTAPLNREARLFCASKLSRYELEDKYSFKVPFQSFFFLNHNHPLNANLPPSTVPNSHLSTLSLFQSCQVTNLQMSTQMPFLICQQYVLRCPLLMGEDSNKMGFCEAKMSFSHTNEAGLTGLEVSSRDSKLKGTMDLPVLYKRSHLLHVVTGVGPKRFSGSSSFLTHHSPSAAHTARLGRAEGMGAD